MDATTLYELLALIDKYCTWAVIEEGIFENNEIKTINLSNLQKEIPKILIVRFRIGDTIADRASSLSIRNWNFEKSIYMMESISVKFKHRVKMHCCTPADADQWLQVAVFGNITFK